MRSRFRLLLDGDPSRADLAASLLSRVVAAAALLLIAATWPLWTSQTDFPRAPFVRALCGLPAPTEGAALAILCIGLLSALVTGSGRTIGRWSLLIFSGTLGWLVLADQHRLQPWAYQFSVLSLILAALPSLEAIAWSRLLVVSIYFYSALSKLDWTFVDSGGGQIVDGLLTFLHVDHDPGESSRRILAGSLAAGELMVAMGLCWRRSRRTALAASLVLHAVLLAALGPGGSGHKPGVLLWNVYFIAQNLVLFGIGGENRRPAKTVDDRPVTPPRRSSAGRPLRVAVRGLVVFAVLFPLSEPLGLCDVWPAWAVYGTGPERLRVFVKASDSSRLPAAVRPYVNSPRFADERCLVRTDRWSLESTRTPLYPQNRFQLGVALALAQASGLEESIYVEIEGAANRWTGRRTLRTLTGSAEIAAALRSDWLNGFPCPFVPPQ